MICREKALIRSGETLLGIAALLVIFGIAGATVIPMAAGAVVGTTGATLRFVCRKS